MENSYLQLPTDFYKSVKSTPVKKPIGLLYNHALALELNYVHNKELLEDYTDVPVEVLNILSGNEALANSKPVALAYAGHQFGHFTMLGDGRALLLGELQATNGLRYDIQLKGSGPTPFSRRGDGRAALGPMLREFIISEAMYFLGIPSTRSLAVVATGEPVYREQIKPGAVLTRVAESHLRVGTFEYAAQFLKPDDLRALADYAINRHYPEVHVVENKYCEFLKQVSLRQARLVAQWMKIGFIHGVMNTDNMSICGETIDYGPCAFMDYYAHDKVFSSIDHQGRYAYGNQPSIAYWNLGCLANSLLPLIANDEAKAIELANRALDHFKTEFQNAWISEMAKKLGLLNTNADLETSAISADELLLIQDFFALLNTHHGDFTNSFLYLTYGTQKPEWMNNKDFLDWQTRWHAALKNQQRTLNEAQNIMRAHNPTVIPRNHQVEKAITALEEKNDLAPTLYLLKALKNPFVWNDEFAQLRSAPTPQEEITETFCGT
jgi:uncharacterized protein YdiU (UPF0061 family)